MKSFYDFFKSLTLYTFAILIAPSLAIAIQTPNSPISPEHYSECRALHQKWIDLSVSITNEYRQCSAENRNKNCDTSKGPDGTIVCQQCQEAFTASWRMKFGDLNELKNSQIKKCGEQVRQHMQILREANLKNKNEREGLISIGSSSLNPVPKNNPFTGRAKRILLNQAEWSSKRIAVDLSQRRIADFKFAVEVQKKIAKIERRATLASDFMALFQEGGTTNEKLSLVSRSAVELKYATGIHPLSDFIFARSFGAITSVLSDSMSTFEAEFSSFPRGHDAGTYQLISNRLEGINRLYLYEIPDYIAKEQMAIAARDNSETFEKAIVKVIGEIVREKQAEQRRVEAERNRQIVEAPASNSPAAPSSIQNNSPGDECHREHRRLFAEVQRLENQIQSLEVGSSQWYSLYERKRATTLRMLRLDC